LHWLPDRISQICAGFHHHRLPVGPIDVEAEWIRHRRDTGRLHLWQPGLGCTIGKIGKIFPACCVRKIISNCIQREIKNIRADRRRRVAVKKAAFQIAAKTESIILDISDAGGDGEACQAGAIIERVISDALYAVWNSNVGKAGARVKFVFCNAGDAIGKCNISQA